MRELLDTWDREVGPVPESEQAAARAAFDELDGLTDGRRSGREGDHQTGPLS